MLFFLLFFSSFIFSSLELSSAKYQFTDKLIDNYSFREEERFGELDIERDFGTFFFSGVPFLVAFAFALSELSDKSLELDRQSPSI